MAQNKDPAKQQTGYTDVESILVDILGDESIRDDLKQERQRHVIVDLMLEARLAAGISQEEMAEQMSSTMSDIERIESSADEMVTVLEMRKWFAACGMSVRFEIDAVNTPGYSPAELMKAEIHRVDARMKALEQLAKQMNASDEIMRHFESFRSGALFNLLALADPPRAEQRITGMAAEPKAEYKIKRKGKKRP